MNTCEITLLHVRTHAAPYHLHWQTRRPAWYGGVGGGGGVAVSVVRYNLTCYKLWCTNMWPCVHVSLVYSIWSAFTFPSLEHLEQCLMGNMTQQTWKTETLHTSLWSFSGDQLQPKEYYISLKDFSQRTYKNCLSALSVKADRWLV